MYVVQPYEPGLLARSLADVRHRVFVFPKDQILLESSRQHRGDLLRRNTFPQQEESVESLIIGVVVRCVPVSDLRESAENGQHAVHGEIPAHAYDRSGFRPVHTHPHHLLSDSRTGPAEEPTGRRLRQN